VLSLLRLAFVRSASDPQQARGLLAEAIEHARASGEPWFVGLALFVALGLLPRPSEQPA
jgi:hypothetical protein